MYWYLYTEMASPHPGDTHLTWNTQQWLSPYSYLTSGLIMDHTIKKQNQKYCWWYNFVLLSIMAQSCAIKIHDEMRTISQSMPITLNAPHSIKNADTLETLTRQLCPFKLSSSHRYVAEWVSKCMVEGVSDWVRVTLCWVSRKISDWVNE